MYQFPSGVQFESMGTYSNIFYIALPPSEKLDINDVAYLGLIVETLDMSGLSVSIGEFTSFIPTETLRQWREGLIDIDTFMGKWRGVVWQKATVPFQTNGLNSQLEALE